MRLVKRQGASGLVLIVLVAAVASLLSLRAFLELTGYRQVGGGNWHIAHVLWGGFFMFVGTMITLTLHGERMRRVAAVVFGFGFGWFIDEMGKFLTRDNNYFFQPAIIFIYVFFVLIFLLYRYLEKLEPRDTKSLLYQVVDRLEEIVEGDFEKSEKEDILKKLTIVGKEDRGEVGIFAKKLRSLVVEMKAKEDNGDGLAKRYWRELLGFGYHKVFKRKMVLYLLAGVAGMYIVEGMVSTVRLAMNFKTDDLFNIFYSGEFVLTRANVRMLTLKVAADWITGLLFLGGLLTAWKKKKIKAITYFQKGLLVNIFLTSVFRFYFEQFSGVFGLMASIVAYVGLGRLRKEVLVKY